MTSLTTTMNFLSRDPLYNTEKPYQLRYTTPTPTNIPVSNMRYDRISSVRIKNMRDIGSQHTFEKNGFTVLKLDEAALPEYEEYSDAVQVKRYLELVAEGLKKSIGAVRVQPFQYLIRKRDGTFPMVEGKAFEYNQPSTVAHIDTTPEEAVKTFEEVNRSQGDTPGSPKFRFQVVNIWKPLRGPLNDWPLALCDASSIQPNDLETADVVYENRATENVQVHYSPGQRWYYLKDQGVDECLVFRQAEAGPGGRTEGVGGVPHGAFPNPLAMGNEVPRESIEVRALVWY